MKSQTRWIREHRDGLLAAASNVLQRHQNQVNFGITATLSQDEAQQVAQFAEDLRGVPAQSGFPHRVTWPKIPKCIRHLYTGH